MTQLYNQDQAYTSGQDNSDGSGIGKLRTLATNNQILGQSFTPSVTGVCSVFAFVMKKIGTPTGNIWVEIRADGADPTVTTLLATSNTINAVSGVLTGYDAVYFTFPTPPTLTSGTNYWALLIGDYSYGASDNVYVAIDTSSPTYAGGSFGRYGNGGAAWEDVATYNTLFREYTTASPNINLQDKTGVNNVVYNSGVVASTSVPSTLAGARVSAEFGADDRLTIFDNSTIRITGSVTIEGWAWNDGSEGLVMWNKYAPTNAGYSFYVQGDDSLIFNASTDGTTNWFKYSASNAFDLSAWHHYAMVYDASGPTIYAYKDGIAVALPNGGGTVGGSIYASTRFGEIYSTEPSSGILRLCDVRIWDTARTIGQINANMNRFLLGNESHLMANYQFQPVANSISNSFFI